MEINKTSEVDNLHEKEPVFIPFAGGKGGVGKSFLCANIAFALAGLGKQTTAVDLDLGGSNLHSFLGVPNKYAGIGDYVKTVDTNLEDFIVPTAIDGLTFLPGDGVSPFMANITYHQKKHLIANIKKIPADFILLDLGAGTSFNVLDYFSISNHGVLVATPEFPAVISVLGFLKNFLLRRIEQAFKRNKPVQERLNHIFSRPTTEGQITIQRLKEELHETDGQTGSVIDGICMAIRPRIIFNMGENPGELSVIEKFEGALAKVLSIEADYIGFVFNDPGVQAALKSKEPMLLKYPDTIASREILQIARRIVRFPEDPIENSAQRLIESTQTFYGEINTG